MKKINKKATLGVGLAMFALADPTQVFNFNNSTLDSTIIKVETQTSYVTSEDDTVADGGKWSSDYTSYINEDGSLVKGDATIGKYKYYFNDSGVKVTGLYTDEAGNTYYYDPTGTGTSKGRMVKGMVTLDGATYYFGDEDGIMIKENKAVKVGSSIYCFDEDGKMVTSNFAEVSEIVGDFDEIEEGNHYFDASGKLVKSGFVTVTEETDDEDIVSTYYIQDYERLENNFKTISKATYYFGSDGKMATGITSITGTPSDIDDEESTYEDGTYYFGTDGKMATGLVNVPKTVDFEKSGIYYFNTKGTATSGWQVVGSDRYYFDETSHKAKIGEYTDSDKEYYFDENGVMVTGFYTDSTGTYYYSEETLTLGQKVKGEVSNPKTIEINGVEYTFDQNGKMQTGFDSERKFYYTDDGQKVVGWFTVDGKTYYSSPKKNEDGEIGEIQTGFVEIDGTTYYFAAGTDETDSTSFEKGEMLKGIQEIDPAGESSKKRYFLGENTGRVVTGWVTADFNGKNYYMDSKGIIQTGWVTIDGSTYYFVAPNMSGAANPSYLTEGEMVTGLQTIKTDSITGTYYFGNDGIMRVGFQNVDGYTYYFNEQYSSTKGERGNLIKSGMTEINGKNYYLDTKSGKVVTGWLTIGKTDIDSLGKTYYMDSRGIVQTGFQTIDGTTYYFDEKTGVLGHGLTTINGDLYFLGENTGRVVTGLVTADAKDSQGNRKVFYMNERGIVQTGFITIGGTTYYFSETGTNTLTAQPTKGQMLRGIQTINGKNYFLGENTGRVVTGWVTADMKDEKGNNMIFYMNERGVVQTGFQTIDGTTYYFSQSPKISKTATGTNSIDSGEVNGQMLKGIQEIGATASKVRYFLGENTGRLVTGWITADMKDKNGNNMIFYMNGKGEIQTGFKTINGTTYYFAAGTDETDSTSYTKGQMLKGIQTINEKNYFLGENTGRVVTGWVTADFNGERYYMDEYGEIQTGYQVIGEDEYYFDKDTGVMQKDTVVEDTTDGTVRYTIGSDGIITKTTKIS